MTSGFHSGWPKAPQPVREDASRSRSDQPIGLVGQELKEIFGGAGVKVVFAHEAGEGGRLGEGAKFADSIKAKYGFAVTQQWLDHVRLGSVRFNSGGSGSFVSAHGTTTSPTVSRRVARTRRSSTRPSMAMPCSRTF